LVLDDDGKVIRIQCNIRLDIKSGIRLNSAADSNTQRGGDPFLSIYDRLHNIERHVRDSAHRMEIGDRGISCHGLFCRVFG
jgi:hypothetical protein